MKYAYLLTTRLFTGGHFTGGLFTGELFTGRQLTGRTIYREDNSPGNCSPEDYSPGVASFVQFSQIAFNDADKARVHDNDEKHN